MNKENRTLLTHLLVYVLLQLLVLYKFAIFNTAFAFFYVAFILLLPPRQSRISTMTIAFFLGLIIDVFSSTPGIHTSATVLVAFLRYPWLTRLKGTPDDLATIQVHSWGFGSFLLFIFPLIFLHHTLLFTLENGSLNPFMLLFSRIFYSSLLTTLVIVLSNSLIANKRRR